jgi:methyl-accepting chemotaxis protein
VDVEGARRGDEIGAMARAVLVFRDNAVRRRELEAAVDREAEERRRQEAVQELLAGFERSLASLLDVIDRAGAGLDGSARSLTRAAEDHEPLAVRRPRVPGDGRRGEHGG